MQIPSMPPPIVTNALPQDVVAKAVPGMQATAPLIQTAVSPTPKSEKFNQTRRNKDRSSDESEEEGQRSKEEGDKGEHSVNISV